MVTETINEIKNVFEEIQKETPCSSLLDGKIYYMNANDGTDFDWEMNDRLCEFMMFHESEMGYIKMGLHSDDEAIFYVYPNGEFQPVRKVVRDFPKGSAYELANAMYGLCDCENLWDVDIETLDFSKAPTFRLLKEEEEEEWF